MHRSGTVEAHTRKWSKKKKTFPKNLAPRKHLSYAETCVPFLQWILSKTNLITKAHDPFKVKIILFFAWCIVIMHTCVIINLDMYRYKYGYIWKYRHRNKDIQIYTNQCRYRLGFFFPLRLLLIRFSIFGRKDTKDYEFVYVDTHIHTCTHTYPMKFQVQKFTI